jgi:hypothetical protein
VDDTAPTVALGNTALVALSVNCGDEDVWTPVPDAANVLFPAFSVLIAICDERFPAELGMNRIETVQVAPGARAPGDGHVVVIGNSPGLELTIPENCTAVFPALVIVTTAVVVEATPTDVFGNATLLELSVNCGDDGEAACTPAPDADTVLLPAFTVLIVICEERLPVAAGMN